ncbi:hypothetical protein ACFRJ9_15505 [Paenarthrobacter sp. NPDC056912]|uniref:hypothetical protein n=1 Tax=Paenarthrobacter sp. NPDC056912 TaxID=3345965 RepID=UPI003670CF0A
MTVMVDSEGVAFSDASCFRCEQAGPHWSSRHGRGDTFACRRCFATFADQGTSVAADAAQAHSAAGVEGHRFFESK